MLKKNEVIVVIMVILAITIPIMVGLLTLSNSVKGITSDLNLKNITSSMTGIKQNIDTLTNLIKRIDFDLLQEILLKLNNTLNSSIKIILVSPNTTTPSV